jgi:hypothetical protein
MANVLRLRSDSGAAFGRVLMREMEEAGLSPKPVGHMIPGALEIVVALGSAGAFTTFYNVLSKLLNANKNREITIQFNGFSLSIKGHSVPEEEALLKQIAPQLADAKKNVVKKNQARTSGKHQ